MDDYVAVRVIIVIISILPGIGNIFDARNFIEPFSHPFYDIDFHRFASTVSYIGRS